MGKALLHTFKRIIWWRRTLEPRQTKRLHGKGQVQGSLVYVAQQEHLVGFTCKPRRRVARKARRVTNLQNNLTHGIEYMHVHYQVRNRSAQRVQYMKDAVARYTPYLLHPHHRKTSANALATARRSTEQKREDTRTQIVRMPQLLAVAVNPMRGVHLCMRQIHSLKHVLAALVHESMQHASSTRLSQVPNGTVNALSVETQTISQLLLHKTSRL
jgi:hypothetical protein